MPAPEDRRTVEVRRDESIDSQVPDESLILQATWSREGVPCLKVEYTTDEWYIHKTGYPQGEL